MDQPSLFDRLGGREGIFDLVGQVIDNHLANPAVSTRFVHASMSREELIASGAEFFCTGLSGVQTYEGRSLADAHAGMNISDAEFNAVIDDILAAMVSKGIGELEQAEALKILWGMRPDVVAR